MVKRLLWLCGYWVGYQKLNFRSITRWLSVYRSMPRILQLYPVSNLYFMSIDRPTVVLKRFLEILWANSVHSKTFAIICGCFYWASSEYWEVKSISCWGRIVFRHCEGKDSRETIKCKYIPSQVESALWKFSANKDHDCDLFMSDVSALYKSCVAHLAKWTTLFAEYKMLWVDSSVCKQLIEKGMKHVSSICLIETLLLMKLK